MLSLRCRVGWAVLALLLAPLATAHISLPMPWKAGTSLRYQVDAVQEDVRAGKNRRTESSGVQRMDIVEAGPQGFLQVWKTESEQIRVTGTAADIENTRKLAQELSDGLRAVPVQAELNADASFKRLRNWQAFATLMRELMLPALVEQNRAKAQAAKLDEAALRAKLQPMLEKLTSEAAVSSSIGRQASIFNFFTAAQLSEGKPIEYHDYLPSPWSADLIPTRGSFVLEKLDASTATIHWRQGVDPDKGLDQLWKSVETLQGKSLSEAERKALRDSLELSDEATVEVDRRTGIPLRLDYRREVRSGEVRKSTRLRLAKLP